MFLEYLNTLNIEQIFHMYPSIQYYKNLFLQKIDSSLLIYTNNIDYSNIFIKILDSKYENARFRKANYKESNPYLYNNYCYIIDVSEWNIPSLKDFVVEFSQLSNVSMIPNLFVIHNFEMMDRDTQNTIGICIEVNSKFSRFWIFAGNINGVSPKVKNRTFFVNLKLPSNQYMKNICMERLKFIKNTSQPISVSKSIEALSTYEILLDKMISISDGNYGKLFLYMDIFNFNPNILNNTSFQQEKKNIEQFIKNEKYLQKEYPKLREICFNLLEKFELKVIMRELFNHLKEYFDDNGKYYIISKMAEYQNTDLIPNKQVWILETWLLEVIQYYYEYHNVQ